MLSLWFAGAFLLRFAARQFLALLFHEPPRNTRDVSTLPHDLIFDNYGAALEPKSKYYWLFADFLTNYHGHGKT